MEEISLARGRKVTEIGSVADCHRGEKRFAMVLLPSDSGELKNVVVAENENIQTLVFSHSLGIF